MIGDTTARLALPLLDAGQAQKELSHNEALTLLDLAVQPAVVAVGMNAPPPDPTAGACWIVGPAPTGAWSGHADALAGWTDGGWRYLAPRDGTTVWSIADGTTARFAAGAWNVGDLNGARLRVAGQQVVGARRPPIADPAGGATVDAPARATLGAVLDALRQHGLIGPAT